MRVVFLILAGCGRLGFSPLSGDVVGDAGGDAGAADALVVPRCAAWGPFGTPVVDTQLSTTGSDDWLPRISTDGLTLLVDKYNDDDFDIALASRTQTTEAFSEPVPLSGADVVGIDEQSGQFSVDRQRLYAMHATPTSATLWQYEDIGGSYATVIEHTTIGSSFQHHWVSVDELRVYWIQVRGSSGAIVMSQRASVTEPFDTGTDVMTFTFGGPGMALALTLDELDLIASTPITSPTDDLDLVIASRPDRNSPFTTSTPLTSLNSENDDVIGSWSADATTIYLNLATDTDGGLDADVWVSTRSCLD